MTKNKKQIILLKISGESLKGDNAVISTTQINSICAQIKKLQKKYIIGIVLGGGNILRGANTTNKSLTRTSADIMGMLATIINSIALRDALEAIGVNTSLYSLITMPTIAKTYNISAIKQDLANNNVVIFAGGTGNPYFSTDSGVALRALEVDASFILMGKNGVDGIYDSDPKINKKAKRYASISYDKIVHDNLKVIDTSAASILSNSDVKILVFNVNRANCFVDALANKIPTTVISKSKRGNK